MKIIEEFLCKVDEDFIQGKFDFQQAMDFLLELEPVWLSHPILLSLFKNHLDLVIDEWFERYQSDDLDHPLQVSSESQRMLPIGLSNFDPNRYTILKQNAGILLIINQFKFYRESNPGLKELLPLLPLNDRRGTDMDKHAVLDIFTAFGYQPIVVENIPHHQVLKQVERAVNAVKPTHRSLVVCLLSHGQEGKIYGSNSIPVNVKSIEKTMASEKLAGKPKLLFVQACQGPKLQSVVEIPEQPLLEHDGPSSEMTASVFMDFLVALSTMPGFASIRHIEKGSWFIQELCLKLRELHERDHIMDILTAVINDVSGKRNYYNECMVPIMYSTLRKKVYFEPLINPLIPNPASRRASI